MSWDHRIIEFKDIDGTALFRICEVYYEEDGSLMGYGETTIQAETVEGLHEDMRLIATAIGKPVLQRREFPDGGVKA